MIELEYAWIYPVRIAVNLDELVDSLIHKVPPLHDGIKKTATGDPVTVVYLAQSMPSSAAPNQGAIKNGHGAERNRDRDVADSNRQRTK